MLKKLEKIKKFVIEHQDEILVTGIILAEIAIVWRVGDAIYDSGFRKGATLRKLPADIFIESMTTDAGRLVYFLNGIRYDVMPH